MKELGSKFKEKRQELDIPLAQARNETKIRMIYLEAIEKGDFKEVEQEVYLKGFLKIYADYLGLDKRKIMQEYREYKKIQEHENNNNNNQENKTKEKKTIRDKIKKIIDVHQNKFLYALITLLVLAIILAAIVLGVVVYKSFSAENSTILAGIVSLDLNSERENNLSADEKNKQQFASSQKNNSSGIKKETETEETKEATEEATEETTEETTEEREEINLTLQAVADSWGAVEVNGETTFRGAITEGTSKEFRGQNIKVKISNGAGIKIIKNGEELGPFGRAGEVIVKEYAITSD